MAENTGLYFLTAVGSGNRFYQTAGILTAGFRYCGAAIEAPLIVGELHSAEDLKAEALAAAEQLGKKLAN